MIPAYLINLLIPKVLDKIADVVAYAREDNELDKKVKALEKDSHPAIFTERQLQSIKKRITKLEKSCKCMEESLE